MKTETLFTFVLFSIAMLSCEKDSPSIQTDIISNDEVRVTAFTATVSGSFNGLTNKEVSYGNVGLLYTTSNDAQTVFQSWKDGDRNPECMTARGTGDLAEGVKVTVSTLTPETEYSCCLFFESEDGSRREISTALSFKTKPFSPVFQGENAESVGFYSAQMSCDVTFNSEDMKLCRSGFIISKEPIESAQTGQMEYVAPNNNDRMEYMIKNLSGGTVYHCRPFVQVISNGNVAMGTEKTFTTRNLEDMIVDMGLSVKWASCNMGAESPEEFGDYYRWAETKTGSSYTVDTHPLYDKGGDTVRYVENICGTEYDAAHVNMKGNWRMPSYQEIEELMENCTMTLFPSKGTYVAEFVAKNGNSIQIPFAGFENNNGKNFYCKDGKGWQYVQQAGGVISIGLTYLTFQSGTQAFSESMIDNSGRVVGHWKANYFFNVVFSLERNQIDKSGLYLSMIYDSSLPIRPVWDPNIQ